jgi:hypothetical protein
LCSLSADWAVVAPGGDRFGSGVILVPGDAPYRRRVVRTKEDKVKKIFFITLVMGLVASSAFAHDVSKRFGLGFVSSSSPIGFRYWFGPKLGLDVGFGISVDDQGDETFTDFSFSAGLPINLLQVGDRVNLHLLPWVQYTSVDFGDETGTVFDIVGALEMEVFVTNDFSLSASQGVDFQMTSPPGDVDSETDISTFGTSLTEFGFHYYLGSGGGGE